MSCYGLDDAQGISKQFDIFLFGAFGRAQWDLLRHVLQSRTPRPWPELDAARAGASDVVSDFDDAFCLEKISHESCIPKARIRQAVDHPRAPEHLRSEGPPVRTKTEQAVYEEFHGIDAESKGRIGRSSIVDKQDMVHSTDPSTRIPYAGGDAGPQQGRNDGIGSPVDCEIALGYIGPTGLFLLQATHVRPPEL